MKPEFSATAPRKIGLDSWQLTPPYLLVLRRCSTAQPGGVACRQVDQARCQASLTGRIGHVVYFDQRLGATWTQKWGSIFRSQTCLHWLYGACCIFRPAFGCYLDTKMKVNFPIPDMDLDNSGPQRSNHRIRKKSAWLHLKLWIKTKCFTKFVYVMAQNILFALENVLKSTHANLKNLRQLRGKFMKK